MQSFPWLTTIGLVPLVGSAIVFALPGGLRRLARQIALVVSLVTLGLVVAMAAQFDVSAAGTQQFTELHRWIPQFGVSYALGINGIGLTMVALSAVLVPICVLATWNIAETGDAVADDKRRATFFALILVLETLMIGVFAARDVFLFYVFFEAMLIPVYFLIGSFGGSNARYAAVKFLLYSLAGGLLMLVAVIGLYLQGPGGADGFLVDKLTGLDYSSAGVERWLFAGFFIAFAVKAPMWPVHTWLPDAAAQAPAGVSVLLVGVLDKVGTFGMITLCLPLFPEASKWAVPFVIVLSLISIIYGALLAIGQSDIMRLIAFTSVSHFGFIVLGIFAMTSSGQAGSTLYMVNHGFSTAALFLIAGMLVVRRGSQRIGDYGGMQRVTPLLAGTFLVAGMSSLALPGLSSFISEILVIVGTFSRYQAAAIIAAIALVLSALYILLMYQRMMTGPVREPVRALPDLNVREAWVVAPLIAVIVFLGFYPKPVLDVLNPAVSTTMTQVGVKDPAPLAPLAADEGTNQ
ncbi:MAG TPA: NADH-quinone oxidoreductase subunit M [Actinomycetales bacterium]|nr:NADH-quinone oxidoreductase subunit M [Actinomycetales bacterium]